MPREREIKIELKIPLESFVSRIKDIGFNPLGIIKQKDIYFDREDWLLYEHLAALRLRFVNNKEDSFSFKKVFYLPNKLNEYYIEEIEIKSPFKQKSELVKIFDRLKILADFSHFKTAEELTMFIERQGFKGEQQMNKTRQIFKRDDDEIVIDEVDKVGTIVELECLNKEPIVLVENILSKNEWQRSVEGTSYIWLKNVKGFNSHLKNVSRFKEESDWNVWDNEREMYDRLLLREK